MGEYYMVVNLTKKEYLDPGRMGGGGDKASCILTGGNHVSDVTLMLMAESNLWWSKWHGAHMLKNGKYDRGYPLKRFKSRWVGRWARDELVLAGDESTARKIWHLCNEVERNGWTDITREAIRAYNKLWPSSVVRFKKYDKRDRQDLFGAEFKLSYLESQQRHKRVLYKRRMRRKGAKW